MQSCGFFYYITAIALELELELELFKLRVERKTIHINS